MKHKRIILVLMTITCMILLCACSCSGCNNFRNYNEPSATPTAATSTPGADITSAPETTPAEPTKTAEATSAVEPTAPVAPTAPTDPTSPVAPTGTSEPTGALNPTEALNPSQSVEPTKSPEATQTVSPTGTATPTQVVSPTGAATPTQGATATETPKPTATPLPTQVIKPTEAIVPKDTSAFGVQLGQYRGIKQKYSVQNITDDDVYTEIYTALTRYAVKTDRETAIKYDIANIDYVGKIDGVAFDGGADKGFDLQLGSGSFIDGFESQIIGHKVGETFDIEVTFPEDYPNGFANKKAVFTITLNSLKAMPELTDEFVKKQLKFNSLEECLKEVRKGLEEAALMDAQEEFESGIYNQIINGCTFDASINADIEKAVADARDYYQEYADAMGVTLEVLLYYYVGVSLEQFNSSILAAATYNVKLERILDAVAYIEELSATKEEFDAFVAVNAETYEYTVEEFLEAFDKDYITQQLLREKANNVIMATAVKKL